MKSYSTLLAAVLLICTANVNAALESRLGGQVVYDSDLNITWLANANLAATNTFGVSGISSNGSMNWNTAQNWIGVMNSTSYLGYNDWRLPVTLQPDASCQNAGFWANCTGSEMGHLFYQELGGIFMQSITTTHNANFNLFQNIQDHNFYWSSTTIDMTPAGYPADLGHLYSAYFFEFYYGFQGAAATNGNNYLALAVRSGDVTAVPVPTAAWLLSSGLFGLIGVARRKVA